MKRWSWTVVLLATLTAPTLAAETRGIERSVVRIVNYAQRANWYTPWESTPVREGTGSGFVIAGTAGASEGKLVMTNAHVVSDSRLLLIYLHNDPNPHHAEVYRMGHDCDLALIRPIEPGVLDNVPALGFGGLPTIGSDVETIGYPAGGNRVSSTRGVVSRIEEQVYMHSGADMHLSVQTDAAINPGNSGGPVIQNGEVVGVAFQAVADLQSVGYFIPVEVTERFLRDVADGEYHGYPELGLETSSMDNPAARRLAGMAADETGTRVDSVLPGGSAAGSVQEGDIIVEAAGRVVANDGTVADGDLRFAFGLLVDRLQVGESVDIKVLRDGARVELTLALRAYKHGHSNLYDSRPPYYVYGGLVFVPLNLEMLKTFGPDWPSRADKALLYEFLIRPQGEPGLIQQERVVLLRRLDHRVNADIAWHRNQLVSRVNGREIQSLEQLIDAFETHDGDYHFIEFASYGRFAVLDRELANRTHGEILERYGVPADRYP